MGTNYYIKLPEQDYCEHCKRSEPGEEIHIGKSSAGWKFLFDISEKSFKELMRLMAFNSDKIVDEYGTYITFIELFTKIIQKQDGKSHSGYRDMEIIEGFDVSKISFS